MCITHSTARGVAVEKGLRFFEKGKTFFEIG